MILVMLRRLELNVTPPIHVEKITALTTPNMQTNNQYITIVNTLHSYYGIRGSQRLHW